MRFLVGRSAAEAIGVGATAVVELSTSMAIAIVAIVVVIVVAITVLAFHGTLPHIKWGKFSLGWSTREDETS